MMKMNNIDCISEDKIIKIITSCKTQEQLKTAINYIKLLTVHINENKINVTQINPDISKPDLIAYIYSIISHQRFKIINAG